MKRTVDYFADLEPGDVIYSGNRQIYLVVRPYVDFVGITWFCLEGHSAGQIFTSTWMMPATKFVYPWEVIQFASKRARSGG